MRDCLNEMSSKYLNEAAHVMYVQPSRQAAFAMSSKLISSYLSELFEAHGVALAAERDWLLHKRELPAIRADWYPKESSGVLSVKVLVRDGVLIEECFAGVGSGDQAVHDALTNFTLNSFHVLLAVLWGQNDDTQVMTEHWQVGAKRYMAYIGNFGSRSSDGVTPEIPPEFFDQIEKAIKREALAEDIHWFRLYFGNIAGSHTLEALKDNDDWEAGVRCLEATAWAETEGFYSVRLFAILRAES